jgi:hypothetical protein
MTDEHGDHKELYYQINNAKEAISELDKQVALLAQNTAHIVEGVQNVADAISDHMKSHKENTSTLKTSAINFGFTMLGLAVAGGVGAVVAKFAGN